jgi:hypothetical protein
MKLGIGLFRIKKINSKVEMKPDVTLNVVTSEILNYS